MPKNRHFGKFLISSIAVEDFDRGYSSVGEREDVAEEWVSTCVYVKEVCCEDGFVPGDASLDYYGAVDQLSMSPSPRVSPDFIR